VTALQWVGVVMFAVFVLYLNIWAISALLEPDHFMDDKPMAKTLLWIEFIIVAILLLTGVIGCTTNTRGPL